MFSDILRTQVSEISSVMVSSRRLLVAFSGVDGSGKSTQIRMLEERLAKTRVRVLHIRCRWRPVVSLPLLVVFRKLGYAKYHIGGGSYIVETRLAGKRGLASLWIILTQLENVVKTGLKLVFPMLLGRSVICDRYVLDMLVDGMAGLHDRPGRMRLGFNLLRLFPRPDFAFFMDIDPEVAFKRKPDLPTLEDYVERLRLYRELSSLWGVTVVNARSSPETIHGELWDGISAKVSDRKRVG